MNAADVKAAEDTWVEAFNAGDASGVAQGYATDARLLPPGADIVEGRSAIEGFVKEFVAMGAHLAFDLVAVHESADLCVAVGRFTLDIPAANGEAQQDLGKFVEVYARQGDGSWLMVEDIFNSSLPAPTA